MRFDSFIIIVLMIGFVAIVGMNLEQYNEINAKLGKMEAILTHIYDNLNGIEKARYAP